MKKDKIEVKDLIKNPIWIKKNGHYKEVSGKSLKQLILENLEAFMSELGEGFCFIGTEYKIKIGDRHNYIDILFFTIKLNCYVVIE